MMTTPDPVDPQAPAPTPVPEPLPTTNPTDSDIQELAAVITTPQLTFEPITGRKGIVTAIATTATPPTISVTLSGDTTVIDGIRFLNQYSPQVGQTVVLEKQGSDIWGVGSIADLPAATAGAGDWTDASLTAGSHNGNSNGNIQYRRVMDNGSWKMQWQGGWNVSGTTVLTGLATDYRPRSKRTITTARDNAGGANSVNVDFNIDGSVTLSGGTTAPAGASATLTPSGSTGGAGSFSVSSHQHGIPFDGDDGLPHHNHFGVALSNGGFSVGTHTHSFTGTGTSHSHSNTVTAPTFVSFNDIEYFL